jgi:probable rRNA maturation factor
VFCDNDFLLKINQKYLKHDYYTDVITFDYSNQKEINGDILISVEQVTLNSKKYNESKLDELYRVMAHGLLHLIGYNDKNKKDKKIMNEKESFYLKMIIH